MSKILRNKLLTPQRTKNKGFRMGSSLFNGCFKQSYHPAVIRYSQSFRDSLSLSLSAWVLLWGLLQWFALGSAASSLVFSKQSKQSKQPFQPLPDGKKSYHYLRGPCSTSKHSVESTMRSCWGLTVNMFKLVFIRTLLHSSRQNSVF